MINASKKPFTFKDAVYYPTKAHGCQGCEHAPAGGNSCIAFGDAVEAAVEADIICGTSRDGVIWRSTPEALAQWTAERLAE